MHGEAASRSSGKTEPKNGLEQGSFVHEERMYSIGEVAEMLGVSREALRYYEKEGLVRPRKMPNGYRRYSYDDYLLLLDIVSFRAGGFSVKDIRQLLFENSCTQNRELFERYARTEKQAAELHKRKAEVFSSAESTYRRIDECQGKMSLRTAPDYYLLERREQFLSEDSLAFLCPVDLVENLSSGSFATKRLLGIPAEDAERTGVASFFGAAQTLVLGQCIYTIVLSPTRAFPQEAAKTLLEWAESHCFQVEDRLLSVYVATCREGCYLEIYLPLKSEGTS